MLHVHATGLTLAIGVHAVAVGDPVSVLTLLYLLLLRAPRCPIPPSLLWSLIVYHGAQSIGSLLLNLVVSTDVDAHTAVFEGNCAHGSNHTCTEPDRITLLKAFGFFEASSGSEWKYLVSIVPPIAVLVYLLVFRSALQQTLVVAVRRKRLVSRVQWWMLLYGSIAALVALLEPSAIGGVYLLSSMCIFGVVAIQRSLVTKTVLKPLCAAASFVGALLLVALALAQNWSLKDSVEDSPALSIVGVHFFCDLTIWRDWRCLAQWLLMLCSSLVIQVTMVLADYLPDSHPGGAAASEDARRPLLDQSHHHGEPLTAALLAESEGPHRAAKSNAAVREMDVFSQTHSDGSKWTSAASVAFLSHLLHTLRTAASSIADGFLLLPLMPLIAISALIISFPAVASLSLFPLLLLGLLNPSAIGSVTLGYAVGFGVLLLAQYFVYIAVESNELAPDHIVAKLWFKQDASSTGMLLIETGCNLCVFFVLLALHVQQCVLGTEKDRRSRRIAAALAARQRERRLLVETEQRRAEHLDTAFGRTVRARMDSTSMFRTATGDSSSRPAATSSYRENDNRMGAPQRTTVSSTRVSFREEEDGDSAVYGGAPLPIHDTDSCQAVLEGAPLILGCARVRQILFALSEGDEVEWSPSPPLPPDEDAEVDDSLVLVNRLMARFASNSNGRHCRPSSGRLGQCYTALTGRILSPEELTLLLREAGEEDPFVQILRERRLLGALPAYRRWVNDATVVLVHYSQHFTILFTFIAGSCVQKMDILHVLVLMAFLLFFSKSYEFSRRWWWILVVYLSALTVFESVFSFALRFFDMPLRIFPAVRSSTVGLVALPNRWYAVPYFVTLFFVAGQHLLIRASTSMNSGGSNQSHNVRVDDDEAALASVVSESARISRSLWHDLFVLHEWNQLLRTKAVRTLRSQLTLFVAAAVFVSLGVFESRSLFVEGFLLLFLVICICTAYGAGLRILRGLWVTSSAYAGIVILIVCAYQFTDIASQIDSVFQRISGCSGTQCQQDLGVVAPYGYVLTYFLAPWFVALATSLMHIGSVDDELSNGGGAEGMSPEAPTTSSVQASAAIPKLGYGGTSADQAPAAVNNSTSPSAVVFRAESRPGSNESQPLVARRQPSTAEMRPISTSANNNEAAASDNTLRLLHRFLCGSDLLLCLSAPDQLLLWIVSSAVNVCEVIGEAIRFIGHEFGAFAVWGSLYVAATTEYTLMSAAYALFLALDLSSITSLVYCVCHLFVLYSYQFSFTPTVPTSADSNSINWAELVGLVKHDDSSQNTAVGPVLVFFAVLFRITTRYVSRGSSSHACMSPTASPFPKSWGFVGNVADYLLHQGLYLIGYELFLAVALINAQATSSELSGYLGAVLVGLLLIGGRRRLLASLWFNRALRLIAIGLLAFQLVCQLNNNHHIWPPQPAPSSLDAASWNFFALRGNYTSMCCAFLCIVISHALQDKRERALGNDVQALFEAPIDGLVEMALFAAQHAEWKLRDAALSISSLTSRMRVVAADSSRVQLLLADRVSTSSSYSETKLKGNVLKHCGDAGFASLVPPIKCAACVDTLAQHLVVLSPCASTSSKFMLRVADADEEGTTQERLASILSIHDAIMRCVVTIFSGLSPVAFLSFGAGTVQLSLICVLLMVGGMMQFAYQEVLHWKFFRLWPPIVVGYVAVIAFLPVIAHEPSLVDWFQQHTTNAAIIGLSDHQGVPLRFSSVFVALLLFVGIQTRVYEDWWFGGVLQSMRESIRDRASKHKMLIDMLHQNRIEQIAEAEKKKADLRSKLREVRRMYGKHPSVLPAMRPSSLPARAPARVASVETGVTSESFAGGASSLTDATAALRGSFVGQLPHLARRSLVRLSNTSIVANSPCGVRPSSPGLRGAALPLRKNASNSSIESGGSDVVSPASPPLPENAVADVDGDKPPLSLRIQEKALRLTSLLLPHTYWPDTYRSDLLERDTLHPVLALCMAWFRVVERHTAHLVVIFVLVNFAQSGTVVDALPALLTLSILSIYHPFAPLPLYNVLANYLVGSIFMKTVVLIVAANATLSGRVSAALSYCLIYVDRSGSGSSFNDLNLDFVAFACTIIHTHVAFANGVYSEAQFKGRSNAPQEQSQEHVDSSHHTSSRRETHEAISSDDEEVGAPPHSSAVAVNIITSTGHQKPSDDDAAAKVGCAGANEDQVEAGDEMELTLLSSFVHFFRNAVSVQGCGVDLYTAYSMLEVVTLLILVTDYYSIAGGENGSIIQNVQNNVVPGPFVLGVLATLLLMMADRMVYAAQNMKAKLVLHIFYTVLVISLYCVWRSMTEAPSLTAGVLLFCFKCAYLYTSCFQIRFGFPPHRRHDPFTHLPDDLLPWLGYQLFRAIPFLWEMRVVVDWTVTKTSLRLPCYLKVENLLDTVYNRMVSIGDSKAQQDHAGAPVNLKAKLSDGVVRIVVIFAAVLLPLLYYSTWNPAMGSNRITQIQIDVSFENSAPFFSSSLFSIVPPPPDLPIWLARTRPVLASYGITSSEKEVQLIDLSSCSNSLWSISPQAQRLLSAQLLDTYNNVSSTTLNLQVAIHRGGGSVSSGDELSAAQTIRHPWSMPWYTAGELLDMLSNTSMPSMNDSAILPLENFYSPYVFNQPSQVQYFPAMTGIDSLDAEECSISLRSEFDSLLQTRVFYWCLKCNSIFSSGNFPTSNLTLYPEWECLTKNIGCNRFNFEQHATNYTPVPMYFVFFSDPIPTTLSFLPNIGLIAIYTTFVLALGRVFRGMFAATASNLVQTDMADPTPVWQLIEYIAIARSCDALHLEQSVYYELIDLMRSPERLLRQTKLHHRMYDDDSYSDSEDQQQNDDNRGGQQPPS